MIATYDEVLNQARGLGEQRHPAAGLEQHAAYANSVAYGVTGMSGGFGGPSMREHQCSRVISNQGGAGTLTFDSAAELLDSLCYGPMTTDIARMRTEECCFDDSEADLKAAAALLVLDPGQLWLHDHAARNQSMRDTLRAWATNPPGSTVWAESEMAMMGVLTQLQPGPPHRLRGADLVAVATALGMEVHPQHLPYRLVDTHNRGWLTRGDGRYEGYDPTKNPDHAFLVDRPLIEVMEDFGTWRPVLPMLDGDRHELCAAFDLAGHKTITSVASALEQVFHEARERHTTGHDQEAGGDYDYAVRTLTAGRPGSWEAAAVIGVVLFGNELNLHPHKASLPVETMRSTGPNQSRVHREARDRIAEVLRAWTGNPDRYTEVPENLAGVISSYADERYGADGWRSIADQWLQPGGLAKENFRCCYRLLYSVSAHFSADLLS